MSSRALRRLQGAGDPPGDEEDSGDNVMEPVKHRANSFNAFSLVRFFYLNLGYKLPRLLGDRS